MSDKQHLQWIHDRMIYQHGEVPNADFMLKLEAIINGMPEEQNTPSFAHRRTEINEALLKIEDFLNSPLVWNQDTMPNPFIPKDANQRALVKGVMNVSYEGIYEIRKAINELKNSDG